MVRIRDRIFQLLEKAQPGDTASLVVDRGLAFLIVANVIAVTLETVDEIYQAYAPAFMEQMRAEGHFEEIAAQNDPSLKEQ